MAKFSYTGPIDYKKIESSEMDQRFTDLLTKANVTKFDILSFRKRSVRYRHLKQAPIQFAYKERMGNQIFTGALTKVGAWNWTDAIVAHSQTAANAPNGTETGHPVIHIHGSYLSNEWETGAYEIGIGYSTDAGVTYTHWAYSNKFAGYTQAHVNPPWSGATTHYHTGAAGSWWSDTFYGKREIHTSIAALSRTGVDVTAISHWALGIRVNGTNSTGNGSKDIHLRDVAKIWLVARDST